MIRENRFGSGTLAAIKALQDRGKGDAIDLAIALLDQDKTWKEGGWMDEMPAEGLLEWLVESPVEKGLRAILQRIDKLPVGLRVDVATGFFGIRHEENKVDEATLAAVEELLVKLADDKRRRTGMSGSIGDFSYSDPRVCDLAMEALRRGWQGRYEFDYQGSLKSRDRQCVIAANVWRKSRGMELLPVPEAAVRTLSDEEFAPLAKRFAAMATPADETAFSYAMMSAGIGALPGLLELEKSAKGKKKEVAASVRRMLSNRVERIEISPQGLDYEPIRKWAEALKGASLDGAAVVRLLSTFFQKASVNGEKVRGIEFEASRDGDLGGVGIRITLTPKERPDDELDQWDGSENVTLAGESVHTAGYGGGLSKDDPKESEELKAGVDKAVSADATAPYEIRWKLVGWWHDDEDEEEEE